MIKNKIWAVIPARSGSKNLKNKNIIELNQKPLIAYTIKSAIQSKVFEKILVLTDSKRYAKIANKYGAEIPFLRPKKISKDKSTDNELYTYMFNYFKKKGVVLPNYFAHLSPVVPIRINNIIKKGVKYFFTKKKNDLQTMRSVSEMTQPAYKMMRIIDGKLCSIKKKDFDLNKLNKPRQLYEKTYIPNGLIDIISKKNIEINKTTHGKKTIPFLVNQMYVDIDDKNDLLYAKYLISKKKGLL
jgi:CMP-N,N'-diacetyllegionaminic acid synthase